MGITISTVHSYFAGEFEEPTQLDIYNNTRYRLVLRASHLNRGHILSNRGETVQSIPARQGMWNTIVRMKGDRTGEEQPLWLKSRDPLALHTTMCFALMEGGVDSGYKLVIKLFRPENKEPICQARLVKHHSPEITINQITDEHTPDSGTAIVNNIEITWQGGRPAQIRLERVLATKSSQPSPMQTFEVESLSRPSSVLGAPLATVTVGGS